MAFASLRFPAASLFAAAIMVMASGCASATTVEVPDKANVKAEAPKGDVAPKVEPKTPAEERLATDDFVNPDVAPVQPSKSRAAEASKLRLSNKDPLTRVQDNPTGTFVGQRTQELLSDIVKVRDVIATRDAELEEIRRTAAEGAVAYHSSVAAINARLQSGTTAGNPILLRQWDEAQAKLDQMNSSISRLNSLSTEVSADASMISYLLGSVKASFSLNGAIDEDHENLKIMQDVVAAQASGVERTKGDISQDLIRLNSYLNTERSNLQTLAFAIDRGEYIGDNLANRPLNVIDPAATQLPSAIQQQPIQPVGYVPAAFDPMARTGVATGAMVSDMADTSLGMMPANAGNSMDAPQTQGLYDIPAPESTKMLALIRFNKPDVAFEKQLYDAVSNALDQMPGAVFTVMAVSPEAGSSAEIAAATAEAQRHADQVKRSLLSMGLPPSRIAMAAGGSRDATVPEVRVMVR